jgi:Uma2 family endonuclease
VFSSSNTEREMKEKRKLYFEQGAKEFWICTEEGGIKFFNADGQLEKSSLVPNFPKHIEL